LKICLVLLYGRYSQENHGYTKYLEGIAEHLIEGFYDKIVLCGGFTGFGEQKISEAGSVINKLIELTDMPESDFILEEESLHTTQNIYQGWKKFFPLKKLDKKIDCTIITDHKHRFKSMIIVRNLRQRKEFKKLINSVNYISFDRPDKHPKNTWIYQTAQGFGYLLYPPFIDKHLKIKERA